MNIRLAPLFALAALSLATPPGQAESLVDGSADAGKAKSLTCAACHGAEGVSANPLWPNIAGQHAAYTEDQLKAFKSGDRVNPLMSSQAMLLSETAMKDLSVYYESLEPAAQPVADPALLARGEALYRGGSEAKGIPACIACHGPTGRGNPVALYPALNGQHAAYTAKTLRDYASGERKSDGKTRMMRTIAARLDDDDIEALASYVQGLR